MQPGERARRPGWYPDPAGQPVERWWTGIQWSGGCRPYRVPRPARRAGGRGNSAASPIPWIAGAFALALVLFAGFAAVNGGSLCGSDIGAYTACQGFLDEEIGAPSTASYPALAQATITRTGANEWQVHAYLTTETATGFEIQHDWTCVATYVEEDRWRGNAALLE